MKSITAHTAFFALLRAGLWNREPDKGCFPLSLEDWEQVFRLARKQTVEGLVYDGAMRLPAHCLPPRDMLLRWTVQVASLEERNRRMNRVAAEIHAFFVANGINAWMVKGQGIAACYENPLHRVCGDIDWCFPDREHFERANHLIKDSGKRIERQAGFSAYYSWKGFLVEHHQHLLDVSNPFVSKYLNRLQQEEQARTLYFETAGCKIPLPSPVLTHLSINTHILKHLLAFGISIRQLCDSVRVCCTYHDSAEGEHLWEIYRRLGIERWMHLLNQLLVSYLGLPEEYLPFPAASRRKANFMMKDILQGGNFGFYGGPFSKETDSPQLERKQAGLHLLVRFGRYVYYAPWEACWFPVVHLYSRIKNRFSDE